MKTIILLSMIVTSSAFAQFEQQDNKQKVYKFNADYKSFDQNQKEMEERDNRNKFQQVDFQCMSDCQRMNYNRQLCVSKCSY